MMANLEYYKVFYHVVKCGSVTQAAGALSLSQPAVSQSLKQLETALGVTLTALYHTGFMDLSDILKKMTFHPACILRIPKGRLAIGADADILIFDPEEKWTVDPERFASKGRNTPFDGAELQGKVKYTIVDGRIVYQDS